MINIESLPKPAVLLELDYNKIKQENINELKKLDPDWEHIESDDFMPNIEAKKLSNIKNLRLCILLLYSFSYLCMI